jgi:hypothetical protein
MPLPPHHQLPMEQAHTPVAWEYADASARTAATGFEPEDVDRVAVQTDDGSLWRLTDDDPVTWQQLGGGADPGSHTHTASEITDFSEAVDDRVASLVVSSDSVDPAYDDGSNELSLDVNETWLEGKIDARIGLVEPASHTHVSADITDFASGVDAAGAVMNADTSTEGMGFVVDEDDMSSNSATKIPTQQSVKAYVDAATAGAGLTAEEVADLVAALLVGGTDISVTYDDAAASGAGTLTIAYTGSGGGSSVFLTLTDVNGAAVVSNAGGPLTWDADNEELIALPPSALGATELGELSDVDLSTPPTDGQALVYNDTADAWEPGTVSVGSIALGDLSNVTLTDPQEGDILRRRSGVWVNEQPITDSMIGFVLDAGDSTIAEGEMVIGFEVPQDGQPTLLRIYDLTGVGGELKFQVRQGAFTDLPHDDNATESITDGSDPELGGVALVEIDVSGWDPLVKGQWLEWYTAVPTDGPTSVSKVSVSLRYTLT